MSIKAAIDANARGNHQEALRLLLLLLNDDFNDAKALLYAGIAYQNLGMNGAAATFFYRASQCDPTNPEPLTGLGASYKLEDNLEGAEEVWRMAYDLYERAGNVQDMAGTLMNAATCYVARGDMGYGLELFEKALKLHPGNTEILSNRAHAHLWFGNWAQGWIDYEANLQTNRRDKRPYIVLQTGQTLPKWDGTPNHKPVVYGEQGIGDEMLFASMIPDVLKICPTAVFDCHPRLVDTWKRSLGIPCYGTRKSADLEWCSVEQPDCSIAVGSLGKMFRNSREDFPGTPYIKPDPELLAKFNHQRRGKPRIGISWKGGSKKTGRKVRSIPLSDFIPLLKAIDADWYSLQYHADAGAEIDKLEMETGIHVRHFPDLVQCENYDRTIAFTASLDLVITACTSILHASGGLGIPTYILTPHESAWRESGNDGKRGPDIPWYGSAKLFHRDQNDPDWSRTIETVRQEMVEHFAMRYTALAGHLAEGNVGLYGAQAAQ